MKKLTKNDKAWIDGYFEGRRSAIEEILDILLKKDELVTIFKEAIRKYPPKTTKFNF